MHSKPDRSHQALHDSFPFAPRLAVASQISSLLTQTSLLVIRLNIGSQRSTLDGVGGDGVGFRVGFLVGFRVGGRVGLLVGGRVGLLVGDRVGLLVGGGFGVGFLVGRCVGFLVGDRVGFLVGGSGDEGDFSHRQIE